MIDIIGSVEIPLFLRNVPFRVVVNIGATLYYLL